LLFFSPFFGCFVLVTFGKFSSFITGSIFKLKTSFARSRTSHPDGGHTSMKHEHPSSDAHIIPKCHSYIDSS
jgi:hypothetical protein